MNRRKVRKLLDSVASQLTSETDALVATLNEIKSAHEERAKEDLKSRFFHYDVIKIVNRALRQVQS